MARRSIIVHVVTAISVDDEGNVTIVEEEPALDGIPEIALARAMATPGAVGIHICDVNTGEQWFTPLEGPA
jgi:hypothetical protein